MGKDINYDWGGFSRKWKSELVAQKGAWMEMRWPRPIWCFLGTLNWSQFPSLLRQPGFITTDWIYSLFHLYYWRGLISRVGGTMPQPSTINWNDETHSKCGSNGKDANSWRTKLTVWCDIWYTRLFGLSPSSIGSSDSEPWRLQGLAAVQVNLSLGGRPRFICCACFARNPKMSAFWGFYGVFPIYYSIT